MEAIAITDDDEDSGRRLPDLSEPKLVEIVHLVEEGKTWDQIAALVKIAPRTIYRWRHEYQIDAIIAQRAADMLRATQQQRVRLVRKASEVLDQWLHGSDVELQQYAIDKVYPKQGGGDITAPALPAGRASKAEPPGAAGKRLAAAKKQGRL